MRVGVVGAGGHSRAAHLPALAELRAAYGLELVAVADTRVDAAERAAHDFGFARGLGDVGALLDEGLDACFVLTPTPVIPAVARRVAERGVPCLIEKPFATTLAEAAALREETDARAGLVMVSANRRFDPAFTAALSWLSEHPLAAIGMMCRSGRREAGFVYNTGVHLVDALATACGPLAVVSRREVEVAGASWVDALVEGAGGTRGALSFAPTAGSHVEELRLMAGERSVTIRFGAMADSGFTGWQFGEVATELSTAPVSPWEREGTLAETRAFLDAVRLGGPSPVPLGSYEASMRIAAELNGPLASAGEAH